MKVKVTFPSIRLWLLFFGMCVEEFSSTISKKVKLNGEYYAGLLQCLNEEIKEKHSHLVKKKVFFQCDNAPTHTSVIVMSKIHDLCFKLLSHPPYLPDLAPSDYYLSSSL